ncbi:MAG: hypothetical protein IKI64_02635 [Clostridia bacterium]|nr:hypothetical protein [Clostridia bacterium]
MKVIKKKGKTVTAYMLGSDSEALRELIESGRIIKKDDGSYEVMSQESVNGQGQIAYSGDYIKVDSSGYPYPNSAEYFNENHRHISGDEYETLPKPLLAWTADEPVSEEVGFLIAAKGLVLDESSDDKFFTAPLWGAIESSPRDSVLVFYSVEKNERGETVDADFNFVARTEFDRTYNVIEERTVKARRRTKRLKQNSVSKKP